MTAIPDVRHGGTVHQLRRNRRDQDLLDASANINPLGPPPWLRQCIAGSLADIVHYPDPEAHELVHAIADHHAVSPQEVVVGNGSSELFAWLPRLEPRLWLVPVPCYGEYRRAPALAGCRLTELACKPDLQVDLAALASALEHQPNAFVALGHPANPSGHLLNVAGVRALAQRFSQALFLIDEAFADFIPNFVSFIDQRPANVLVTRSATKVAAIPGLRLGWLIADAQFANRLRHTLPPWSVNHLAQRVGVQLLKDEEYLAQTRSSCEQWRTELLRQLSELPLQVVAGAANYVLFKLPTNNGPAIVEQCLQSGVALRSCSDYPGLGDSWLRCAVRPPAEQKQIIAVLTDALGLAAPASKTRAVKPRARALMIQGCSSDAGKSVLTAALCRCLYQDGVNVAPFKAQNMSNNAGVDAAGRELGRAQMLQATACGLSPHVDMNPVLLKPNSDTGSQVIVNGRPIGNRDAISYLATKAQCKTAALAAFDRLSDSHDVIICEGAGSPGEINLRQHDFVNMGFVAERDMPVLLVGDIDRGGCYASFIGHLEVMAEWERARVRGLIVNRFRGDASLLGPAHTYVQRFTGASVIGVVPHVPHIGLPDEDRLSLDRRTAAPAQQTDLDIAVIGLPHIANADDVDPLDAEPDVTVRLVQHPGELGQPHAIIIPGSKNVLHDGQWLQQHNLQQAIGAYVANGGAVVGLCAGYQLIGQQIIDPTGIESSLGKWTGLGLLGHNTELAINKVTTTTQAHHQASGCAVHGYEIHHGVSTGGSDLPAIIAADGRILGHQRGRVWGTYLHGIFQADAFRRWWLDDLRSAAGLEPLAIQTHYDVEPALDRLAAVFRESVDLDHIYQLLDVSCSLHGG